MSERRNAVLDAEARDTHCPPIATRENWPKPYSLCLEHMTSIDFASVPLRRANKKPSELSLDNDVEGQALLKRLKYRVVYETRITCV